MIRIESSRLRLRQLTRDDAAFVLRLLNEPSFHEHIGDRGVRTLDQAHAYLEKSARSAVPMPGLGAYLMERASDGAAMGLCTLIKRDTLDDIDLGYALVPEYWGAGYAEEACRAMLAYARVRLELRRLVAIVSPGNMASIRLLDKLGFRFERNVSLGENPEKILMYGIALDSQDQGLAVSSA